MMESSDAELFVLPELFNTGYLFVSQKEVFQLAEEIPRGKTTEALIALAGRKKIFIVAGLAERDGNSIYNSAVLISPGGYIDTYRKIHLFNEEKLWFQPGNKEFNVYDLGQIKVGMMICFDWYFPESARILALKGADVVCHPANLVLPHCQDAMVTRCLENRIFVITANRTGCEERGGKKLTYTGRSQITSPVGKVLVRSTAEGMEVGAEQIDTFLSRNKRINDYNDLFLDRRSEHYRELA